MSEPRTWWINNLGAEDAINGPLITAGYVEVIEKSAYDSLVALANDQKVQQLETSDLLSAARYELNQLRRVLAIKDLRAEHFESTVMATVAERDRVLGALNQIAILGMGPAAYTSDFTEQVNGIVRTILTK